MLLKSSILLVALCSFSCKNDEQWIGYRPLVLLEVKLVVESKDINYFSYLRIFLYLLVRWVILYIW